MTVDIYNYIYIHIFFVSSIGKQDFSASYIDLLGDIYIYIYQVLVRHQVVDVLVNQAAGKISKFNRRCKQNAPTALPCRRLLPFLCLLLAWPPSNWKVVLAGICQCQVFTFHSDLRGWNILWCNLRGKLITNIVCVFNSVWSQCISTQNKCTLWKVARIYIKKASKKAWGGSLIIWHGNQGIYLRAAEHSVGDLRFGTC